VIRTDGVGMSSKEAYGSERCQALQWHHGRTFSAEAELGDEYMAVAPLIEHVERLEQASVSWCSCPRSDIRRLSAETVRSCPNRVIKAKMKSKANGENLFPIPTVPCLPFYPLDQIPTLPIRQSYNFTGILLAAYKSHNLDRHL
jgi:hypothetical protein